MQISPILWLAAAVGFLALEASTFNMTSIWFAIGAAAALISCLFTDLFRVQALLFIVVISLLTPAPSAEVLHEFDHYLDDPDDRHVDDDLVAAEIAAGEKRSQI